MSAHHNLQLLYAEVGEPELAREHELSHLRYKPDDNAQGRGRTAAREKYPAANFAAEAVVRYPLQRPGAPGLNDESRPIAAAERSRAIHRRRDTVNRVKSRPRRDLEFDAETEERDDAIIGTALRWSLAVFVVAGIGIGGAVWLLRVKGLEKTVKQTTLSEVEVRNTSTVEPPHVSFTDITEDAGITFRHENGAHGGKLLPETMGGGCAFLDFDSDGDQDLLFVNVCGIGRGTIKERSNNRRRWPSIATTGTASSPM